MINIGAGATIPLAVSFVLFFILGIVQTRKDPNLFTIIINVLQFYRKSPLLILRRRVSYVA